MRQSSRIERRKPPQESTRQWFTGVVVIAATIISFIGFARISFGWTLAISTLIFVGLVFFLWSVGARKQRSRTGGHTRA